MSGMPRRFVHPAKLAVGDRVAVLSPSWAGPGVFPHVQELGLQRLRTHFGLEPVEYPTTRRVDASPQDRADDIHAAFADPEISAIMASIGGEDQIKVLRHLDPTVLQAHPKAFFGYSDSTNLLNYLWNLGIAGYYGGSTMVHLGRHGALNPVTGSSLRTALFETGTVELDPVAEFTDEHGRWEEPEALDVAPRLRPAPPWTWRGEPLSITGRTWGGCLEIIDVQLRVGRYLLEPDVYAGCVLLLETSEEMPSAGEVYRILMCMGERGLLGMFAAVVVAKPKAWDSERRETLQQRAAYTEAQRESVIRALDEYNPGVPTVFGLDFGHTDPQVILPMGGQMTVDGTTQKVYATY